MLRPWIILLLCAGLGYCPAPLVPDVRVQTTPWSRKLLRQHNGADGMGMLDFWVNAAAYGADGSDAADDTDALEAAIAAATGQVLWIPQGVYYITNPLVLPNYSKWIGAGPTTVGNTELGTSIVANAPMSCMIRTESWTNNAYQWMSTVQGIRLDGNNTATNGMQIHRPGENFILRDLHIEQPLDSCLWLSGSAATFSGYDLLLNKAGDYAIRWSSHPDYNSDNGSWRFWNLSGDRNTNGWMFISAPHYISIDGWKTEYSDSSILSNHWVRITDAAYDGMPTNTFDDAARCYLNIQGGTADWVSGNASLTNFIIIDGTSTRASVEVGLTRFRGETALNYFIRNFRNGSNWVWNATLTEGFYNHGTYHQ